MPPSPTRLMLEAAMTSLGDAIHEAHSNDPAAGDDKYLPTFMSEEGLQECIQEAEAVRLQEHREVDPLSMMFVVDESWVVEKPYDPNSIVFYGY